MLKVVRVQFKRKECKQGIPDLRHRDRCWVGRAEKQVCTPVVYFRYVPSAFGLTGWRWLPFFVQI